MGRRKINYALLAYKIIKKHKQHETPDLKKISYQLLYLQISVMKSYTYI